MKSTVISDAPTFDDARLVEMGARGDREAFGQLVTRYQSPVCALAYNWCGDIARSEDLAQEAFIIAWRKLASLDEPAKFKPWLYGITRNLLRNNARSQSRNPLAAPQELDDSIPATDIGTNPIEQTISAEEKELLWRSIEKIPETYREPLILFYRENQSLEKVADTLNLTEDAARQRLSRGRKLLQEQVLAFVEGALRQTGPGTAFTLAVVAALPMMSYSAKAAGLAAAAKGGAAVKGTLLGSGFGILLGPALGLLGGYLGWRAEVENTRTPRERALVNRKAKQILAGVIVFFVTCCWYGDYGAPWLWKRHPHLVIVFGLGMVLGWCGFVFTLARRHNRAFARIREEDQRLHPEKFLADGSLELQEYRSRATLLGLPLVHCRGFGRGVVRPPGQKAQPAVGWIAIGEVAYGILYASGGVAIGGISMGGLSIGLIAVGGAGFGLLAFGGLAVGALALGGGSIGWLASGGMAAGWRAAMGGIVVSHQFATGGLALAPHADDEVARAFFRHHPWMDFAHPGTGALFLTLCIGPLFLQLLIWHWMRRKLQKDARKN